MADLSAVRGWLLAASHTLRLGPVRLTVWPRSLPWLVQIGRRQWWTFDRGQNRASRPQASQPDHLGDIEHLRVALFTDLLVYDYSGTPPEHPDKREVCDLRKQADWLIERGWTTNEQGAVDVKAAMGNGEYSPEYKAGMEAATDLAQPIIEARERDMYAAMKERDEARDQQKEAG